MTAPLPLLTEEEVMSVMLGVEEEHRSFGSLSTEHGLLPLTALDVHARIVGTFAHTTLTQRFANRLSVPVEATYIFPLPDRAAVTRFVMEVAGRRVEGDLQEREQARRTYDTAIAAGQRASIAEEERPGTFTLRVGNLMPGEDATITLELTGPLPVADGEVTYRFPLVVGRRYNPGQVLLGKQAGDGTAADTDAVPDASRISPPILLAGYPNPVRLSIAVTLDPIGLPLTRVRSALHVVWADEAEGLLRLTAAPGERLNRDFILRFCLGDQDLRTTARATRTGPLDAFLLTVLPPLTSSAEARPRDLVFVLDRSGSMGGWKMIAARRAVARMIDALRPRDRFAVLAFDNKVEMFAPVLTLAEDRHRFRAVEWLASIDARGGTEMAGALSQAAHMLDSDRDRVLVFVTDGQVGNEAQLVRLLGQRLKGTRVFALGIDQAVNAGFLNRLAALGGQGEAELVESEDRVDEVLARCHRRIDAPLLSELTIAAEGATLHDIAPSRLPDVFAGVPASIVGRLRRGGSPVLVIRGKTSTGDVFEQRVTVETTANRALLPAWARLHLRDLEDRFDAGAGDRASLERQIVAVSLEAKVLCRFTAFVAVDPEIVNEGGKMHRVVQAVESTAGAEPEMDVMCLAPGAPPPPSRAVSAAPSARPQAARAKRSAPSLVSRALDAMFAPAPASPPPPPPPSFQERIEALCKRLERGEDAAEIAEELRLLIEEMAHAGVTPSRRKRLDEALVALRSGDVVEARRLLEGGPDRRD